MCPYTHTHTQYIHTSIVEHDYNKHCNNKFPVITKLSSMSAVVCGDVT